MDIHVSPLAAGPAIGAIFGDDISQGPLRAAPIQLLKLMNDWPKGHDDRVFDVYLQLPLHMATVTIDHELRPGETPSFLVKVHRVQIICAGKLMGHALRMDAISMSSLAAWEATAQAQLRRLRQVH